MFYIISLLLLGIVIFGWYGIIFLNSSEILMEDNSPMDAQTKLLFSVVMGSVILSWTLSFFTMIRQMLIGYAFSLDGEGVGLTATAINIFAFIFVVPVKKIPYSAIEKVTHDNGMLTVHIDKSKIDVFPIFRVFVTKKYHFFSGFTKATQDEIKAELEKYNIN